VSDPAMADWAALPTPRPLQGAPPAVVDALRDTMVLRRVFWGIAAGVCVLFAATGDTARGAIENGLGAALPIGLSTWLLVGALVARERRVLQHAPVVAHTVLSSRHVAFLGHRGARYEGLELAFGRTEAPSWWMYPGGSPITVQPGDTVWIVERSVGAWVFGGGPRALSAVRTRAAGAAD
jgi:hypothetical protein